MSKRGLNIYKRKDGRWEGRYIKGRKQNNKPIYGYIYARKYSVCKEKLTQAKMLYPDTPFTGKIYGCGMVAEFMEYWLTCLVSSQVKASTLSNYHSIIKNWISVYFKSFRLVQLDRESVQCFINSLSEKELSSGTIRNIYIVLQGAMKQAYQYGYILHDPCKNISLPKLFQKEAPQLTIIDQRKLEQAAKNDKNGLPILMALYTGLRAGEICALQWKDIDFKQGLMHISRTRKRIQVFDENNQNNTKLVNGTAKSNKSVRTIPLPKHILLLLREMDHTYSDEYVFLLKNHPLEPRVLQYRFSTILKKAGLNHINFHALRHTFATRCMELSIDVKTISELLGHSSAKMTLDRYGHSQIEQKKEAIQKLAKKMSNKV